jgi:hypothetical protein
MFKLITLEHEKTILQWVNKIHDSKITEIADLMEKLLICLKQICINIKTEFFTKKIVNKIC